MPRLPHNVEKSAFFPNTYVAYDARGYIWHIRKSGSGSRTLWTATPAPNNPARNLGSRITGDTLGVVALALEKRGLTTTTIIAAE